MGLSFCYFSIHAPVPPLQLERLPLTGSYVLGASVGDGQKKQAIHVL